MRGVIRMLFTNEGGVTPICERPNTRDRLEQLLENWQESKDRGGLDGPCNRDVSPRLAGVFRSTHYDGTVSAHVWFAAAHTAFCKGEDGATRKCQEVWDSVAGVPAFAPLVPDEVYNQGRQ